MNIIYLYWIDFYWFYVFLEVCYLKGLSFVKFRDEDTVNLTKEEKGLSPFCLLYFYVWAFYADGDIFVVTDSCWLFVVLNVGYLDGFFNF